MAQRVRVQLIDDVTGEEANETVRFALDGTAYEIDLTTANADELRSVLATYVESARREKSGKSAQRTSATTRGHREEVQRMRAWALENGHTVNARGRVSKEVQNAYYAAH